MADAFSAAVAAEEGDAGHEDIAKAAARPSLRQEAWQLTKLAVPPAVANLCEYLPVSFAMWFVGRSRAADAGLDLDAMSLGRSYFNVTCFSVSYGLISAMRTLCPQAVGAGKGRELHGLYAQRALCVVAVGALGGCAAIYFAEPVLVHVLGQKRALAKLARRDEVLLSLDALMEERPREAAAFVSAREAAALRPACRLPLTGSSIPSGISRPGDTLRSTQALDLPSPT